MGAAFFSFFQPSFFFFFSFHFLYVSFLFDFTFLFIQFFTFTKSRKKREGSSYHGPDTLTARRPLRQLDDDTPNLASTSATRYRHDSITISTSYTTPSAIMTHVTNRCRNLHHPSHRVTNVQPTTASSPNVENLSDLYFGLHNSTKTSHISKTMHHMNRYLFV